MAVWLTNLLRDDPDITYVDYDLPEATALASYYLMKSLPDRNFRLYGEGEISLTAGDAKLCFDA